MADPKDFSKTAASNTSVGGVNIDEGANTAQMNDSQRAILATLAPPADFGATAGAIKVDDIAESTAAAGVTIDGLLIKDGDIPNVPASIVAQIPTLSLPLGHIEGLIVSNNSGDSDHDVDISSGECRDVNNSADIRLLSTITKQINTNWSAGTGQGGFPSTGITLSADTWYRAFALLNNDGVTVDAGFDTASNASNLLADAADYTQYRQVGWVLTDASSNIIGFNATLTAGGGLRVRWDDPPLDLDTSAQSTTAIARALSVPTGIQVEVWLNGYVTNSGGNPFLYVRSPDQNDEIPSNTAAPMATIFGVVSASQGGMIGPFLTNTSGEVTTRANTASTTVRLATIMYEDSRR